MDRKLQDMQKDYEKLVEQMLTPTKLVGLQLSVLTLEGLSPVLVLNKLCCLKGFPQKRKRQKKKKEKES